MDFLSIEQFKSMSKSGQTSTQTGIRKEFTAEVKTAGDSRVLQFTISTDEVDRTGDRVLIEGWNLEPYKRNGVVLWAHKASELPIARATRVWTEGGKLKATAEFAPADLHPFADTVFRMYQKGFLHAVSVGFLPKKWAWAEDSTRKLGIDFQASELLEFSAVSVPANSGALMDPSLNAAREYAGAVELMLAEVDLGRLQ
jgi:HK97 family phage prohead protease